MRWARRGGEEKAGRSVSGTTFATMNPDGIFQNGMRRRLRQRRGSISSGAANYSFDYKLAHPINFLFPLLPLPLRSEAHVTSAAV